MSTIDIRELIDTASVARGSGMLGSAELRTDDVRTRATDRRFSPVVLTGLVAAVEVLLTGLVGMAIGLIYVFPVVQLGWPYLTATILVPVAAGMSFQAVGAYSLSAFRNVVRTGTRLVLAWTVVFLACATVVFLLKAGEEVSRVWLVTWYVAGVAALSAERVCVSAIMSRLAAAGRFDRRTAIVGGGEPANEIIRLLQDEPESGIRIVGVFDDRDDDRSPLTVGGVAKLGRVSDLVDYARRTPLDLIIFTIPISAEARLLQMLSRLWVLPIDIRLSAHSSKLRLRPRSYSYVGSVPVLDLFDKPIADWDLVLKWLFDKVVGSLCLVLLSPVLLLAALAVKLDSRGPVLFRQKRYGFNNELIEVLKFRSMYADQSDMAASRLVTKGDPRVTRVGRFLRRTSIDELPQLLNVVFKGNLSLVGPRPHALQAKAENRLYDQVVDGYFARHRVRPGITGWAQINGWRGETDTEEKLQRRVEHDLYYIENWSVFLDLYIMATTPFALLRSDGAY